MATSPGTRRSAGTSSRHAMSTAPAMFPPPKLPVCSSTTWNATACSPARTSPRRMAARPRAFTGQSRIRSQNEPSRKCNSPSAPVTIAPTVTTVYLAHQMGEGGRRPGEGHAICFCSNLPGAERVLLGQWLSFRASNFPWKWFTRSPGPRRRPFGKTFFPRQSIRQTGLHFSLLNLVRVVVAFV